MDYETFFNESLSINPNISIIKGKICGVSVETIEYPIEHIARCLDKLVDELANGKTLEKIINVIPKRIGMSVHYKSQGGKIYQIRKAELKDK